MLINYVKAYGHYFKYSIYIKEFEKIFTFQLHLMILEGGIEVGSLK